MLLGEKMDIRKLDDLFFGLHLNEQLDIRGFDELFFSSLAFGQKTGHLRI